ncbi:hypothetical protein LAWI1_G000211 [Lachnellula willkommii]|uniref:ER-bound oxygenase mpaB/mpaB'/Rubber oxygenase catalytic domain-containing protein n=1 Tax=Lachnellula willkommii TaxID=215461 RepID=A0A559MNK4_9HELO|nr:hypothetical protein LAWI1_G000211 [Lachnellula willkommii]
MSTSTTKKKNSSSDHKTNLRTKWGYTMQWTPHHLSQDEIEQLRAQFDERGAEALQRIQAIASKQGPGAKGSKPDMFAVLRDHHEEDDFLAAYWEHLHAVPEWVDWEQIERGQRFFARYFVANCSLFAFQAFVRDNAATPGVAEVVSRTGGLAVKHLLARLIETFTWFIQITHDLQAIQPGGQGHISTIRVRLLHSSVRQRILDLEKTRPGYFNVEKYGPPVNDLVSRFHLPKATFESMLWYELVPNDTSKILAQNFIKWIEDQPPAYLSLGFMEAACRWMNGNEMCDALGLGRPALHHYAAFAGHNIIVSSLAWAQRIFPPLDRFVVAYTRKTLHNALTKHVTGPSVPTNGIPPYSFKYVPNHGQKMEVDAQKPDPAARKQRIRPFECVFMAVFVVAALLSLGLAVGVVRMLMRLNDTFGVTSWIYGERGD